jgi:CRISPR-associated protein Cmr3
MKLQLEALDTLFFRDGRPFNMGEESQAEGLFPPLPSTVLGAFRSLWISLQLEPPKTCLSTLAIASERQLDISYFGLSIADNLFFPAPCDLFFAEKDIEAKPMKLVNKNNITSSCSPEVTCFFRGDSEGKTQSVNGRLIDNASMDNYVKGNIPEVGLHSKPMTNYMSKEPKIGIGRSNETHLTEEGQLFRVAYNRLENRQGERLNLLVEVNGFDDSIVPISQYAVLPLGGERRSVAIKSVDFKLPEKPTIKGKFFKLCLLTPGLFSTWYPTHLKEKYKGLQLIAAAVGRPVSIGGWDLAKQKPKAMRKAAPAGSVFLFEATDEAQANQIAKELHGFSSCESTDKQSGFGLCFIAQPFDNQNI